MESATPEPGLSMQTAFNHLIEAHSKYLAGETIDPRQAAYNLTFLYQGLKPEHRKRPGMIRIMQTCGKLAIDPETGDQLVKNTALLRLIYPSDKRPKYSLKTKAALTLAAGTAAVGGTVGILISEKPDVSAYLHRNVSAAGSADLPTATVIPEQETPTLLAIKTATKTISPTPTPTATKTATATATATHTKTPTPSPTASPTPTVNPEEQVKKEYGDINLVEYFLNDLIRILKERRLEKAQTDPAYAERIDEEFLNSDSINFLYLGIDNTRERLQDYNTRGWGRSDIVMLVTFDPKTFQVNAVSFPRDMFAPELTSFRFQGGARINSVTMAPFVDSRVDSFKLAEKIIETATGVPVDFAFKTNIDFMQGDPDYPSFFDTVFPDGLPIYVPYDIRDNEYPTANYGSKKLFIAKGDHLMNGRELTEFGRSRHDTSDFDRSERQRLILQAAFKQLLPDIFKDFASGKTDTLDRLIAALEQQEEYDNLSSDLDIIEVAKTIKNGVAKLRQDTKGLATLALLSANSTEAVANILQNKDQAFNSLGLTRANSLVANVGGNELFYWQYMLKVNGSSTTAQPTKLGNHLNYWKPVRKYLKDSVH